MKGNFASRLQTAINLSGLKPIEVANRTGLDKSLISCYLSGKYKPGDENLSKLADVLNVSEIWLQGYDVDLDGSMSANYKPIDELEILFSKNKDILTESDKAVIRTIIEERKKEIDKELDK